jgi:hypothetical protein
MLKRKKASLMSILVCMAIIGFSGIAYAEVKIVDNGDPDATPSGTWLASGGANPYGTESLYAPGDGRYSHYEWKYKVADANEDVDIDIWWTWFSNRCNKVSYIIFRASVGDNFILHNIASGYIDQTDINAAGRWNELYTIPYTELTSGECYIIVRVYPDLDPYWCDGKTTCADAVRFSNPPAAGGGDCGPIKAELEKLKNDLQAIINSIP